MPRNPSTGIKYLLKRVRPGVPLALTPWSGRYKGHEIVLAKWADCEIDPRTKDEAKKVLRRFLTAVDTGTFDPAGERVLGAKQTLATFIQEWRTHYAEAQELSMDSLGSMLDVLAHGALGDLSLNDLAGNSERIEKWLNATGRTRKWKAKTWNGYHNLLNRLFGQAMKWTVGGKPRMTSNPMMRVSRKRKVVQPEHFKHRHLVEDVEDRLFAACEQLNRPAHPTKGTEMRRRLIGAFDGGLRVGEMLKTKIEHINWKTVMLDDGSEAYEIVLPPAVTKGGKTTGKNEIVYAGTARFKHLLESRRFEFRNNPPFRTYVFGAEDGSQQLGFRRMWRQLFKLAGLEWGRDKGVVWHTIRHEYISRMAEKTLDPVLTQEMARHKDLETTQGYFHTRVSKRVAAAVSLERAAKV